MKGQTRVCYWDNVKWILTFLVALGHFLFRYVDQCGNVVQTIFISIYLFHVPAFVFTSGYFSKHFINHGKENKFRQVQTLLAYLILYVLYQCGIQLICNLCTGQWKLPQLLYVDTTPWYLLGMFFWLLFLLIFHWFDWKASLLVSIVFSLLFSVNPNTGTFLSSTRCVVFFPFFLMGYYIKFDDIKGFFTKKNRILAFFGLILIIMGIASFREKFLKAMPILYGNHSYAILHIRISYAILLRFAWYLLAFIMMCFVLLLIPRRKLFISYLGQHTLAIYIFHRLVKEIFDRTVLYTYFDTSAKIFWMSLALSVVCCVMFGGRRLDYLIKFPFRFQYRKFLRKQGD